MNARICSAESLDSYLAGTLNADEEAELIVHLDECDECRNAIEQRAGEGIAWEEASKLLAGWQLHRPPGDTLPPSDDQLAAAPAAPQHSHQYEIAARRDSLYRGVQDALGPTDDPAMLGRLGEYEISGIVGSGAMGVVLKAHDRSLDRIIAIKVLAPHLASSGSARRRFAREAKAAAAVLHPNVVAIHSVATDAALPYLVMPYLRGESLQKRIDREGPLPVSEVLRIGAQIAAGLAAAHTQGLVHRDIKPANILLEEGVERVSITDFGLARAVDDATMTRSGVIAGTPQFMSPEQARGEMIDARSDLFSLGTVMYSMCTGRSPFRAETTFGVLQRINTEEPRPIPDINPDVPPWLSNLIKQLMAKSPQDRIRSASELAELLDGCLAHHQQPAVVELPTAVSSFVPQAKPIGQKKGVLDMIVTSALLITGFLGVTAATNNPNDIAGVWAGEDWSKIEITANANGRFEGTYSHADGESGNLKLKWSRLDRRFVGTWGKNEKRLGKIAIRRDGNKIVGARSAKNNANVRNQLPRLGELRWSRFAAHDSPHEDEAEQTSPTDSVANAADPASLSMIDQLQGTWSVAEARSSDGSIRTGMTFKIEGRRVTIAGRQKFELELDESKSPAFFVLRSSTGSFYGRCEMTSNKWTLSMSSDRNFTQVANATDAAATTNSRSQSSDGFDVHLVLNRPNTITKPKPTSPGDPAATARLLRQLQGSWQLTKRVRPENDQDRPIPLGTKVTIQGTRFTPEAYPGPPMQIAIDASHIPAHFDISERDTVLFGRCQVDGEKLKLSIGPGGWSPEDRGTVPIVRPRDVQPHNNFMYLEFTRVPTTTDAADESNPQISPPQSMRGAIEVKTKRMNWPIPHTMQTSIIKGKLPPEALKQIRVGQPCVLSIDAYPDQEYKGRVTAIDADDVKQANAQVQVAVRLETWPLNIASRLTGTVTFSNGTSEAEVASRRDDIAALHQTTDERGQEAGGTPQPTPQETPERLPLPSESEPTNPLTRNTDNPLRSVEAPAGSDDDLRSPDLLPSTESDPAETAPAETPSLSDPTQLESPSL